MNKQQTRFRKILTWRGFIVIEEQLVKHYTPVFDGMDEYETWERIKD